MPEKQKTLARGQSPKLAATEKNMPEWNTVPKEHFDYMREIQARADTITPSLKALLDFRPPPHWETDK